MVTLQIMRFPTASMMSENYVRQQRWSLPRRQTQPAQLFEYTLMGKTRRWTTYDASAFVAEDNWEQPLEKT